jgi:hypothetical protein
MFNPILIPDENDEIMPKVIACNIK